MTDLIILAVLAAILIPAAVYIYKAKKRGDKCIGCPAAKNCGGCDSGCAK